MLEFGYTIIKDLHDLYRSGKDKEALRKYLRELARDEARFNLDLLDIILRVFDEDESAKIKRACSCFRSELPAVFSATGLNPSVVFDGENKFARGGVIEPTFSENDREPDTISFTERLSNQDCLYLYFFSYRKIEILRSLASSEVDLGSVINLKARGKNIKIALIEFLNRMDATIGD